MALAQSTQYQSRNWELYWLYTSGQTDQAHALVQQLLTESGGLSEYALFMRGLLAQTQGNLTTALSSYQAALCIAPQSLAYLKAVARILVLMGKIKDALQAYDAAERLPGGNDDWLVQYGKGTCHMRRKDWDAAVDAFEMANAICKQECTFIAMIQARKEQQQFDEAIEVVKEALDFAPASPDLLTTLGLLYLRTGDSTQAFVHLGTALTHDPRNFKAILAAASILQDNGEYDVALTKYRVAAAVAPHSAQLWNNVGMAFFGKRKFVAALACLKRAHYLDSLEWIIAYNLGLVHLHTGQFASAFHFLSAAISLKPGHAPSYALLGAVLMRLEDHRNACGAYKRALAIDDDAVTRLNYAVSLWNAEQDDEAKDQFAQFASQWSPTSDDEINEVVTKASAAAQALGVKFTPPSARPA